MPVRLRDAAESAAAHRHTRCWLGGTNPLSADRTASLTAKHRAAPGPPVPVSTSGAGSSAGAPNRPRLSAAQLLAAKNTRPIRSLDDLAADTFESDAELAEFLAFTYAEHHRDLA